MKINRKALLRSIWEAALCSAGVDELCFVWRENDTDLGTSDAGSAWIDIELGLRQLEGLANGEA
ncbi:MAG: hypothetical protein QOH84_1518 [Kribbellaceae bacterium]|nr:hypothetical protein [Kribbellaceae bacterium]